MTSLSEAAPEAAPVSIVALHFLGGSAGEWAPLQQAMSSGLHWITVDLPGFGASADAVGYAVADMADAVADAIRRAAPGHYVLAGHSMGAKVACAVARLAEDGETGLGGLERMILLAGSPPSPEPMDDAKRAAMLAWFAGSAAASRDEAHGYIADNVGDDLQPDLHAQAVADVLRAERAAWIAWLAHGSREDWAARIGVLRTPALILAGEKDEALGADAQAKLMAPHFARARLHILPGAGHLLPLERPAALATLIGAFLDDPGSGEPAIDPAYLALIGSPRVSPRTRAVLLDRAAPPAPGGGLAEQAMATLRAVVDRVLPQQGEGRIDLAARVAAALARSGDGWRFADLPADVVAYQAGLDALDRAARHKHGQPFASLDDDAQDALLRRAAEGDLSTDTFTPRQVALWFEDLRSTATQAYVAHPATQAAMGYGGIAIRGDGTGPQGFVLVGAGQREPWEPEARAKAAR